MWPLATYLLTYSTTCLKVTVSLDFRLAGGLIDEKNEDQKSRDTIPLKFYANFSGPW
jgi:hypothetical protein